MTLNPVSRALLLAGAATLLALGAHAQSPAPATPTPAAPAAASAESAEPRYSARDIERAFSFMDSDRDGKISREEASGFRGVARHFDEADLNKDKFLSREEFENALNGDKTP